MSEAPSASSSAAPALRALVKPLGGFAVPVGYRSGDDIAALRSALPPHGISEQAALYAITKEQLDATREEDDAFLATEGLKPVGTLTLVTADTRLLAVPPPPQPPVANAGAGGAAPVTEERMRAIFREEKEAKSVAISSAPASLMWTILNNAKITQTTQCPLPVVPAAFLPSYREFSWARGEEESTPDACVRLTKYLREANVRMNASPGFKVVDVHTRSVLTSDLGRIKLVGKTDAIVTTMDQADIHSHRQARIIVDFKTLCPELAKIEGQSLAELVASASLSCHDVMVVFMDLNEKAHIWRASGHSLLLWQDCSTKQAITIMAEFLNTMCAATSVDVDDPGSEAVLGPPEAKRARKEASDNIKALVPTNQLLLDQLEAFAGQGDEGWMAARELVYGAMETDNSPFLSYFS